MHAVVKKEYVESWMDKLKEQSTYAMHNFKVVPNKDQYKVCDHPYKLLFMGATTLREK